MRVNLYSEELTTDTELVEKKVVLADGSEETFYGIRIFLKSADTLHYSESDDDRSAVTFWVPWTRAEGHDFEAMRALFNAAIERVGEIPL